MANSPQLKYERNNFKSIEFDGFRNKKIEHGKQ